MPHASRAFQIGLVPIKYLPFLRASCSLFQAAASFVQVAPDEFPEQSKEIDVNAMFRACTRPYLAKRLHAFLVVSGRTRNIFISTKLTNLYAYLGDLSFSRRTFNQTLNKDVYNWNSMMSAYVRSGLFQEAIDCFYQFLSNSGCRPDFYTFPSVLKACRNLVDGKRIHCYVLKLGFEWDVFVAASVIHMYTKFGFVPVARKLFDEMPLRDMGSWNAMISGCCQNGDASEALDVLAEMRREGIEMDPVTIASILSVCAQSDDPLNGMLIHQYAVKHGLDLDLFVSNALIDMYAKFGNLVYARKVFDDMVVRDIVSWNSIIAACELHEKPTLALNLFSKMQLIGMAPDLFTLVSLSSIVSQLNSSRSSRSVHGYFIRRSWITEDLKAGNAVVNMYGKLGMIDKACAVFEGLSLRDAISWNTLITGYSQNGLAIEAIEAYSMMQEREKIKPNQGTWVSILSAYSHLGALRQGMKVHGQVIKNSLYLDIFVGTCLVDMYGKCGRLNDAISLFSEVPRNSSVPWNAVIASLGVHGHGEKAMVIFREMLDERVQPDQITFVSLLSACSHSGMVDEGQWCFCIMQQYGIKPALKHYGCMVDLYGRAGCLEMAYNFIKTMPLQPDASIWGALLGACRKHGNVELGTLASNRLFEVDPENVGYYVLLSNIYANTGKWEGVDSIRALAKDRGLRKTPGWSSIEVNNKVDVFYTGNQSHPSCEEIYKELRGLTAKMKTLGYIPDYSFVLQDVEEDEKEHILLSHNERLAIAFGIISTPPKTPIRIFKNLRVCGDCHNATKYISRITEREIIVRDSNRFHHFKDGACSCGDYW